MWVRGQLGAGEDEDGMDWVGMLSPQRLLMEAHQVVQKLTATKNLVCLHQGEES